MKLSPIAPWIALLCLGCSKSQQNASAPQAQSVETMAVTTMTLKETIGLIGTLHANESAEIRSEIPGTITDILFKEGASVKKGQPLIAIDARELHAQLAETRASFLLSEQNLKRDQILLKDDAISQQEVDAAVAAHSKLKASLELLELKIQKSSIQAPFDGYAGARSLSVGDYISPSSIITTVDDISHIKVEMNVPERYLPNLQLGGSFSLSVATASDKPDLTGQIYFISPRIDETTRTTLVKGTIHQPPSSLKPGMFANISLILKTVEQALVVPETAILNTPKGTVLITPKTQNNQTTANFIPVLTGLRTPGFVQITPVGPPIQAGDSVVSAGAGGLILFPGMPIQPVPPVTTPSAPSATDRVIH